MSQADPTPREVSCLRPRSACLQPSRRCPPVQRASTACLEQLPLVSRDDRGSSIHGKARRTGHSTVAAAAPPRRPRKPRAAAVRWRSSTVRTVRAGPATGREDVPSSVELRCLAGRPQATQARAARRRPRPADRRAKRSATPSRRCAPPSATSSPRPRGPTRSPTRPTPHTTTAQPEGRRSGVDVAATNGARLSRRNAARQG